MRSSEIVHQMDNFVNYLVEIKYDQLFEWNLENFQRWTVIFLFYMNEHFNIIYLMFP